MHRALQGFAYLVALGASTAVSFLVAAPLLRFLPGGAPGFVLAALGVAVMALGVAGLERALPWAAWFQLRREPIPASLHSNSGLLAGRAPLPLASGVFLGALLAARLT